MKKPTKSERVSFRCTKKEKEKLESRSEKLGMSLTDYAAKMLFSDVNDCKGLIPLIIEIQDVVSIIEENNRDNDSLQEEVDNLWKMIKNLM